ncbi:hypothetical protein D3C86_2105040 [compost metagenome]
MGAHQALAEGAGGIAAVGGEGVDLHPPSQHQQAALVHQQEHQQQAPGDQAEQGGGGRGQGHCGLLVLFWKEAV